MVLDDNNEGTGADTAFEDGGAALSRNRRSFTVFIDLSCRRPLTADDVAAAQRSLTKARRQWLASTSSTTIANHPDVSERDGGLNGDENRFDATSSGSSQAGGDDHHGARGVHGVVNRQSSFTASLDLTCSSCARDPRVAHALMALVAADDNGITDVKTDAFTGGTVRQAASFHRLRNHRDQASSLAAHSSVGNKKEEVRPTVASSSHGRRRSPADPADQTATARRLRRVEGGDHNGADDFGGGDDAAPPPGSSTSSASTSVATWLQQRSASNRDQVMKTEAAKQATAARESSALRHVQEMRELSHVEKLESDQRTSYLHDERDWRANLRDKHEAAAQGLECVESRLRLDATRRKRVEQLNEAELAHRRGIEEYNCSRRIAYLFVDVEPHWRATFLTDEQHAFLGLKRLRDHHYVTAQRTASWRIATELDARMQVLTTCIVGQNGIQAEERRTRMTLLHGPFEAQMKTLRNLNYQKRLQIDDETRRARIRHEEELREQLAKQQRLRTDRAQALCHGIQAQERVELFEDAARQKVLQSERWLRQQWTDVSQAMKEVHRRLGRFLSTLEQWDECCSTKPIILVVPTVTSGRPAMLFEDVGKPVPLDTGLALRAEMPAMWRSTMRTLGTSIQRQVVKLLEVYRSSHRLVNASLSKLRDGYHRAGVTIGLIVEQTSNTDISTAPKKVTASGSGDVPSSSVSSSFQFPEGGSASSGEHPPHHHQPAAHHLTAASFLVADDVVSLSALQRRNDVLAALGVSEAVGAGPDDVFVVAAAVTSQDVGAANKTNAAPKESTANDHPSSPGGAAAPTALTSITSRDEWGSPSNELAGGASADAMMAALESYLDLLESQSTRLPDERLRDEEGKGHYGEHVRGPYGQSRGDETDSNGGGTHHHLPLEASATMPPPKGSHVVPDDNSAAGWVEVWIEYVDAPWELSAPNTQNADDVDAMSVLRQHRMEAAAAVWTAGWRDASLTTRQRVEGQRSEIAGATATHARGVAVFHPVELSFDKSGRSLLDPNGDADEGGGGSSNAPSVSSPVDGLVASASQERHARRQNQTNNSSAHGHNDGGPITIAEDISRRAWPLASPSSSSPGQLMMLLGPAQIATLKKFGPIPTRAVQQQRATSAGDGGTDSAADTTSEHHDSLSPPVLATIPIHRNDAKGHLFLPIDMLQLRCLMEEPSRNASPSSHHVHYNGADHRRCTAEGGDPNRIASREASAGQAGGQQDTAGTGLFSGLTSPLAQAVSFDVSRLGDDDGNGNASPGMNHLISPAAAASAGGAATATGRGALRISSA